MAHCNIITHHTTKIIYHLQVNYRKKHQLSRVVKTAGYFCGKLKNYLIMAIMEMEIGIDFNKTRKCPSRKTFILKWNPDISSYTMKRFEDDLDDLADGWELEDFDWSVWEWEKASKGDKFYMVRVGAGNTGIVMSGVFTSDPYLAEDWSGRGRKVYYMLMDIHVMIHPDRSPLLTTEELAALIPDMEWSKGHSGQLLDPANADKLDKAWEEYLSRNADMFKPRAVSAKPIPE